MCCCCWKDERTSHLTDCVLKHLVIGHQFDVYASYSHPRRPSRCPSRSSTRHGCPPPSDDRRCRRRWYLGVNRRGHVRTIKTRICPPPRKTFFHKFWVYSLKPTTQNPFASERIPNHFTSTTTPPPPPTTVGRRWPMKNGRQPAFPLLSYARRRNGSRRPTLLGSDGVATAPGADGTDCGSNLLSSCGRRRNASEDGAPRSERRRATRRRGRGGRRRGGLLSSV